MARIPKLSLAQLAALTKLADGDWHSLASFATNTQQSLLDRGAIEPKGGGTRVTREYRITDAGRSALNLRAL